MKNLFIVAIVDRTDLQLSQMTEEVLGVILIYLFVIVFLYYQK